MRQRKSRNARMSAGISAGRALAFHAMAGRKKPLRERASEDDAERRNENPDERWTTRDRGVMFITKRV
jgi:hypothetical protein